MSEYKEVEGIDATTYAGKAALAVKTKARGILGDDLLIFKLVDFVSFMILNNKFLRKGFGITEDSKEESYIKIIESNDEGLINDLEKYISLCDDIKKIEEQKNEFTNIIKQLQILNDHNNEESVNKIVESYLRR